MTKTERENRVRILCSISSQLGISDVSWLSHIQFSEPNHIAYIKPYANNSQKVHTSKYY